MGIHPRAKRDLGPRRPPAETLIEVKRDDTRYRRESVSASALPWNCLTCGSRVSGDYLQGHADWHAGMVPSRYSGAWQTE